MPVAINDAGDVLTLGDDGQWKPAPIAEDPKTGSRLYLDGKEWKPLDTLRGGQENDKAGLPECRASGDGARDVIE